VDADGDGLAVGLLAVDALDVDHVLEAVDGGDLALTALVGTTDDGDLVILANGDGADLCDGLVGGKEKQLGGDIRCTSHGAPWRGGRS
jgi:hypothetical protein